MSELSPFQKISMHRASGNVLRWHTDPYWVGNRQNIAEHTFGLLIILMQIAPGNHLSVQMIRAALFHDLAEQVTGDIPGPAKWFLLSGATVDWIHETEMRMLKMTSAYQTVEPEEARLIKAADFLDMGFMALEQFLKGSVYSCVVMDNLMKLEKKCGYTQVSTAAQEVWYDLCLKFDTCIKSIPAGITLFASTTMRNYAQEVEATKQADANRI